MANKTSILCVDDEPQILEGLALHLGRRYRMYSASSGAAGLALLGEHPEIGVVLSDMRMPGMDGAAFLARVRAEAPDATRMLLTGHAEIKSAIAAVNEGQIFRFLTKPCPPKVVLAAMAAAVEQHRLVTAERVLLQQTLYGAIKTLTDVLALVAPAAFGRANRIKQLVVEIAEQVGLDGGWQVEMAAMLSQLAQISLPTATAERMYAGQPLSEQERERVAQLPALTEQLLANIPRIDGIREILRTYTRPYQELAQGGRGGDDGALVRAAQVLRVAVDFDLLESAMGDAQMAISAMRGRAGQYEPAILDALARLRDVEQGPAVLEVPTEGLREGMILAEDVKLKSGALFLARGQEISARFLQRIASFPPEIAARKAWRVVVPPEAAAA